MNPNHAPLPPHHPGRRRFIGQCMAMAGLLALSPLRAQHAQTMTVANITGLYSVAVARIVAVHSTAGVVQALRDWPGQLATGGGRYSMGGQTAVQGGLHLDMRPLNRLVWLDAPQRRVRVQAGMRWRELQAQIDPLGLAVKTMQSYANFTVGGSVSVNAHGRYVGHGPVGHSVRALQIVLADGRVVETSPTVEPDLFRAAIGGYGAVGVITEVELDLAENVKIARQVQSVALQDYVEHFSTQVLGDPTAVLHNADLLPPEFDVPVSITWRRVPRATRLTETTRLRPHGQTHALEQSMIWALTELPGGAQMQKAVVHPLLKRGPAVCWLNYEASLDVAELEPRDRSRSTYALQEYFVPAQYLVPFVQGMGAVLRRHRAQALNVSIRHSPRDRVSVLPWAAQDVFCFVVYFKQGTSSAAQAAVGRWTRELIDLALQHEGRYYLPYQLHASAEQFKRSYPEAQRLRELKQTYDPQRRLTNELWRKYL